MSSKKNNNFLRTALRWTHYSTAIQLHKMAIIFGQTHFEKARFQSNILFNKNNFMRTRG